MDQKLKKALSILVIVLSVAAVICIAFGNQELHDAWDTVRRLDLLYILGLLGCWAVYAGGDGVGIWFCLRRQGFLLSAGAIVRITLCGFFYSNITPGASGGQPMQVAAMNKAGVPVGNGTTTVTIRLICNQFMVSVLSLAFLIANREFIYRQLEGAIWFVRVGWVINFAVVPLVLLAAPVWLAAQVLNTPVIVVYRFGLYGALFFLGYFVFSHDRTAEVLKKNFPAFAATAVLLGVWFCARCFGENFADKPVNRTPLYTSYCWFACLAILGGAARYADFENGLTRWMNRRSYGLYVFHYLGISSVALWIAKPGLASAPAVYALSLAAGFAAGYLFNAVISRAPFFRWAVLGLGKEEKKNV